MPALYPASLAMAFLLSLVPGCWISDGDPNAEDAAEEQAVPARSGPDTETAKLLKSKKVSLDLMDTPLEAVIQSLREQSGAMIVVDPAVCSAKTEDELLVTLMVDEIPLGEALNLVVGLKGLFLKEWPAYLLITTESQTQTDLKVIDVRDLTASPDSLELDDIVFGAGQSVESPTQRDLRVIEALDLFVRLDSGESVKLATGADESLPLAQQVVAHGPTMTGDELNSLVLQEVADGDTMTCGELAELVRNELPWGNWDCPPNQISYRQGNLIVRNTPDVIERVLVVVERLREERLRQHRLRQLG
jgi:hypothetical protein